MNVRAGRTEAPPVVVFKVVVDPRLRGRNTYLPPSLPPQPDFLQGRLTRRVTPRWPCSPTAWTSSPSSSTWGAA